MLYKWPRCHAFDRDASAQRAAIVHENLNLAQWTTDIFKSVDQGPR